MGREINEEKEFSRDIDRILAGEDIEPDGESQGYQAMLGFASKLNGLRDAPSSEFKEQLKRRLLLKLAEQEAAGQKGKPFREVLKSLIHTRPVWRAAVAAAIVAVIVLAVVWRLGLLTRPPDEIVTFPPPTLNVSIELRATTLKNTYATGEQIIIELIFKNVSAQTLDIAPFPPELVIANTGDIVVRRFPAGNEAKTLAAGASETYTLTWDQHSNDSRQVAPDGYFITMETIRLPEGKGTLALVESPSLSISP